MTPEVRDRIDQIRQGIVPEGYKNTKFGILPDNWSVRTIAECLERVERPVDVQANKMYTQIGIRSHGKGLFYKEPVTGDSLGNKAVFWIEPNCFILNIVFAWEQAIGKTTQAEVGMIGSHRFPMYRPTKGNLDIDYLIFYLLTKRGTDILEAASPGGAGRNRTLGQDRFMKSRVVLPPLDEQKKITAILATQDKAIELQTRKIDELKRFKKGCMEKMFPKKGQKVPEKRFPGFAGDWEQRKLGEIVDRVVRKNTNNESSLPLTISAQYGLVDQITYFNNRVASRDVSNYYLVLNGEFAYNKSTSDGYPFGAVKRLDLYEKGVLSTLYIVFAPKDEQKTNSDFLTVFFDTDRWHKGVAERAAEGARNHGLLNISAEDFFDIALLLPSDVAEQSKIGAYFRAIDHLITLHQRKLEEMKKQKKALMQLLLTGIVRTKGDEQ